MLSQESLLEKVKDILEAKLDDTCHLIFSQAFIL